MAVDGLLEGVAAGLYVIAEGRHALTEARYRRLHLSASGDSVLSNFDSNKCAGILFIYFQNSRFLRIYVIKFYFLKIIKRPV